MFVDEKSLIRFMSVVVFQGLLTRLFNCSFALGSGTRKRRAKE